ncbi:MAG: Holliday junction resolvase RecU [Lachnospiraceae bacterium]|nr:Holliday junction resolvase RecU [Lachnospiraceae bacterium]
MALWNSTGLRGSGLEESINITNERYRRENLALVQKIPTSIIPLEFDQEHHKVKSAYFEKKSTVDYIGVVQGVPVCFDAKECRMPSFPLQNVHEHQMEFMKQFERQQGISFFIVYFERDDAYYYMPYRDMQFFWDRAENGGRKSIMREEFEEKYRIPILKQTYIHYLEILSVDLESREDE